MPKSLAVFVVVGLQNRVIVVDIAQIGEMRFPFGGETATFSEGVVVARVHGYAPNLHCLLGVLLAGGVH